MTPDIDPASIPQDVVDAAARIHADWEGVWKDSVREQASQMIAAALTVLTDELERALYADRYMGSYVDGYQGCIDTIRKGTSRT